MIVKRNFSLLKVWGYIQRPMLIIFIWSGIIWLMHHFLSGDQLALSFTPVGVLGSAVAIFIGFRNNSAYSRWWEARKLWEGILNSSRVLSRLIITFADSHSHQANYEPARSEAFKKSMVRKVISWAHALRLHLRNQEEWQVLSAYLNEAEIKQVMQSTNKPYAIQMLMGREIYQAMSNGTLGGFDSFQMEGQLLALTNYQGGTERIKNTPLPRQYDYFTRLFVTFFTFLLPFGLLDLLPTGSSWFMIPLTFVIAAVFVIMERTGAINEAPFENKITDVPLTFICNTIERDLLSVLGESDVPGQLEPENGYLF